MWNLTVFRKKILIVVFIVIVAVVGIFFYFSWRADKLKKEKQQTEQKIQEQTEQQKAIVKQLDELDRQRQAVDNSQTPAQDQMNTLDALRKEATAKKSSTRQQIQDSIQNLDKLRNLYK